MKLHFKELAENISKQFDADLKPALEKCLTRISDDKHTSVECNLQVTENNGLRLNMNVNPQDFSAGADTGFSDEARFFGISSAIAGYAMALNEEGIKVESSRGHYWTFDLNFADAQALALFVNHGEKDRNKKINVIPKGASRI